MSENKSKHQQVIEALAVADGPMSANELWEHLRSNPKLNSIGIATVYRSLKKGVEDGELVPVELESGSVRYESSGLQHHHHFLCSTCSRAYDVEGCVKNLEKLLPQGFEMTRHEILLYGLCADCKMAG